MKKIIKYIFAGGIAIMMSSAAPKQSTANDPNVHNDTIAVAPLKASAPYILSMPATPDSIFADSHSFNKEKLLESLATLSPMQREALTADYTTLIPQKDVKINTTENKENSAFSLQRVVTNIRPDAYLSGKIAISTPDIAKLYVNGKEIVTKSTVDSIPTEAKGDIKLQPYEDAFIEVHLLSNGDVPQIPEIYIIPDKESAGVNIMQSPDLKGHFNIYSLAGGEKISNATLSPDGNYILTTKTYNEDGISTDSYTYVTDRSGKKVRLEDVADNADWLPGKNSTLVWLDNSNKSGLTLITYDLATDKRGTLASNLPEGASSYTILPDASGIIFYQSVKGEQDKGIMRRVRSLDDRQTSNRSRAYLSLYKFKEGVERPLTYGGPTTYLLDISPDSKKILYSAVREMPEQFPFYQQRLMEMDLATFAVDSVPGIDSSMTEACYSPDGKLILVAAGPNAFRGIGLNAGRFSWGNDYDIQLYLLNPERDGKGGIIGEGTVTPLTRDFDPSVMSGIVWNTTDKNIYFRGETGYDAFLYRLDPKTGKINRLNNAPDYTRQWSIAQNRPEYITAVGMSYDYSGREYLIDTRSKTESLIAEPNSRYMNSLKLGESKKWSFTCPADAYTKPDTIAAIPTTVECTVTFPPDFDPNKKYPLIVYYYGGTSPSSHTNHSPYTPHNFASKGYVVLAMNPSGTTGYGQEYSARHVNAWGDRTADEIIYGTKLFCDENDFINRDKVGCIGASYGGFMTQLLQTKTDIFAAAVSHAGISNITSYWGEGWWGYSYNSVAAARSYPWSNPQLFTENSPLFAADKIHTPLLLLHGTVDTNVPIGESIQLYNALKLLGRDVELVTVEGSDHIVIDFEKRKEWFGTIMAWFERWLKDDPRWWNELY